jgi:hypothetical protein
MSEPRDLVAPNEHVEVAAGLQEPEAEGFEENPSLCRHFVFEVGHLLWLLEAIYSIIHLHHQLLGVDD